LLIAYVTTLLAIAIVLFAIPCVLPWRWLFLYVPLVAAAIGAAWWDHFTHELDMGVVGVFSFGMILAGTAAAIGGLLARLIVMALRARRVRWRYAWLPMPALFALLIAAPFLLMFYSEFDNRPPSEECLVDSHRLGLADTTLSVPPAPVFIVITADETEPFNLAWPDKARAFCRMVARSGPLPVRRISLNLDRHHGPLYRHEWHPQLCTAIRERPWMHRLCDGPALAEDEHYPEWMSFASSEEAAQGSEQDLWALYKGGADSAPEQTDERVARRLRATNGTMFAAVCGLYNRGRADCDAVFEPRPGLAVYFRVAVPRDRIAAELIAVQARVAEIARDLLRP
jgi:hypothetical protein